MEEENGVKAKTREKKKQKTKKPWLNLNHITA